MSYAYWTWRPIWSLVSLWSGMAWDTNISLQTRRAIVRITLGALLALASREARVPLIAILP